jgi:hypothetical protein
LMRWRLRHCSRRCPFMTKCPSVDVAHPIQTVFPQQLLPLLTSPTWSPESTRVVSKFGRAAWTLLNTCMRRPSRFEIFVLWNLVAVMDSPAFSPSIRFQSDISRTLRGPGLTLLAAGGHRRLSRLQPRGPILLPSLSCIFHHALRMRSSARAASPHPRAHRAQRTARPHPSACAIGAARPPPARYGQEGGQRSVGVACSKGAMPARGCLALSSGPRRGRPAVRRPHWDSSAARFVARAAG